MNNHLFSRRTLLRGLGVTMALPWLESLPVWGDEPRGNQHASEPPVRLAVLFSGNGFHSKEWWAKGEGKDMELGKVLAPLDRLPREDAVRPRPVQRARPPRGTSTARRPATCSPARRWPRAAKSAPAPASTSSWPSSYGHSTKVPSLVLGCEKSNPSVHKNYSMLYSSHISWSSPTTPTPLELYPALAFDRLFKDEVERGDKSVLDAVLDDASDLRREISATDQRKLDEYLDSVRDVEQRIDSAGKQGELQGWRPTLDKPNMPRPADGIPQDIAEHMRLMCDILVLGFQTDTTRICTLKLNNDHSSLRFPNLGVDYMIHHLLSHSDTADWLKVNQFFLEQVAYIARKLDAIQEGERTVLDNTMLLFCSSMMTRQPRCTQLPVVMLGGGGGQHPDRPRARLPRQAEPPDVPPVSVDDGQDERAPRQVRRRQRTTLGGVARRSLASPGDCRPGLNEPGRSRRRNQLFDGEVRKPGRPSFGQQAKLGSRRRPGRTRRSPGTARRQRPTIPDFAVRVGWRAAGPCRWPHGRGKSPAAADYGPRLRRPSALRSRSIRTTRHLPSLPPSPATPSPKSNCSSTADASCRSTRNVSR